MFLCCSKFYVKSALTSDTVFRLKVNLSIQSSDVTKVVLCTSKHSAHAIDREVRPCRSEVVGAKGERIPVVIGV